MTIAARQRKERFDKLPPLAQMAIIAIPVMIVMTSYTIMQLVDSLMVSRIGPEEVYVAAQGNGGMVPYVFMAFSLGLCTVINTYVSQNLGAGKKDNCAPYGWNGLWISLGMALTLVPVGLMLPYVFSKFNHSEQLQQLETAYGQILIAGAFFPMAARSIAQFFYGVHKPSVIMVAVLTGNTVNLLCNAVLIFGAAGAPEGFPLREQFQSVASFLGIEAMGLRGAAIGTVIGGSIEFGIPFLVFLSPRFNKLYKTRSTWKISGKHIKDLLKLGWPGSLMFFNEMFCWALLLVWLSSKAGAMSVSDPALAEHASTVHTTAGWIALRFMQLSFMPGVGISIAITALVGRNIGMGRPDLAAKRTWLGMKLTLLYMGGWALIFVVFPADLIRLYTAVNQTPAQVEELVRIGTTIMWAAAVFQLFDAVAISLTGALRGAGDTVWPGMVTIIFSWVFIILGGLLMLFLFPTIGAIGPWIAASAYIVALGIAVLFRFLGGKWKTIKLVERHTDAASPDGKPVPEPITTPADG
jgi:MATE family, multidrug efflux pump